MKPRRRPRRLAWHLVPWMLLGLVGWTLAFSDSPDELDEGQPGPCFDEDGDPEAPEYDGDGPHAVLDLTDVLVTSHSNYPEGWFVEAGDPAQLVACMVSEKEIGPMDDCVLDATEKHVMVTVIAQEYDFAIRSLHDGRTVAEFSLTADGCPQTAEVIDLPEATTEAIVHQSEVTRELEPLITDPVDD